MQFILFWRESEFICWTLQRLGKDRLWMGQIEGKGGREKMKMSKEMIEC
jgi:hypothetical protein